MEWDDDLLISLVQKYPQLWNKRDMQFKNKNAKSNAWRTIACILDDRSAEECERRFTVLRNKYASEKRSEKASTASGIICSHATSQWPHYQAMGFLDAFISFRKRRNTGNVVEHVQDHPKPPLEILGKLHECNMKRTLKPLVSIPVD
ncbi:unnamed protein product [Brassicogethes aeneus]|uniref:MADF domain-containing protein n=1 Tax=Brassicogethes aeneus TaxID=1431903 RepID=A0A9P0BEQ5_BRAAE|nr:unnamed protein product [Brassicogethes aeneus]